MEMKVSRVHCLVVIFLLCVVVTGCGSRSPLGRQRTLLFQDGQVNRLAEGVFRDLKAEHVEKDPNSDTVRTVQRTADALIARVDDRAGVSRWEVVVFQDDSLWTMAMGGKIAITTGVVSVAQNPGQLAWLLACEISRVTARHANEAMSEEALLTTWRSDHGRRNDFWTKPRSEMRATRLLEADALAQVLMSKAGFDPVESIHVIQRLAAASSGGDSGVFKRRIENLQAHLQKAASVFEKAKARGIHPDVEADKAILRK
jgi:predicted Zn-dependent protease